MLEAWESGDFSPKFVTSFTGSNLLGILSWYREMWQQTHDATIPIILECIPDLKTRRRYERGLWVIGHIGESVEDLRNLKEAAVWQEGPMDHQLALVCTSIGSQTPKLTYLAK